MQDYNSLEKPNKSQITHVDLDLEILDILKVTEQNQVHVMTISQAGSQKGSKVQMSLFFMFRVRCSSAGIRYAKPKPKLLQ